MPRKLTPKQHAIVDTYLTHRDDYVAAVVCADLAERVVELIDPATLADQEETLDYCLSVAECECEKCGSPKIRALVYHAARALLQDAEGTKTWCEGNLPWIHRLAKTGLKKLGLDQ